MVKTIHDLTEDELSTLAQKIEEGEIEVPESLGKLLKGYGSYATEVATDRAIISIDGLKPSQRRILYTACKVDKVKDLTKSNTLSGNVLKFHPHGDSIYTTMVRMVSSTKYMNVPFFDPKGSFSHVNTKRPPAQARYTYVKPTEFAYSLFKDFNGVRMIPTEDSHYEEPELLPTPVPNLLFNPSSGIAVGVSSNIFSYHPNELVSAVIELIETGGISEALVPEFPTGGNIVRDTKNFEKIMRTGRGQITLRGNWVVDGKNIILTDIPYYTTYETIKKEIKDAEIEGIKSAKDFSDRSGNRLEIECRNKAVVDSVLTALIRDTSFQIKTSSNIVVIIDDKPQRLGVVELLRQWVKFRKNTLERAYTAEKEGVENSIPKYELLVALMRDEDARMEYITKLTKENEGVATQYLREKFTGYNHDDYAFILTRTLKSLSGVGNKETTLQNLRAQLEDVTKRLNNLDGVVVQQLREFNAKNRFARKCEATDETYDFDKRADMEVKAQAVPCIFTLEDKFIRKIEDNDFNKNVEGIRCMSDDIITIIDTQGRLLRVVLENIPFTDKHSKGVYLPVYLDVEDDFDVVVFDVISDKKSIFIYKDGYASVLDYSEWLDAQRITRVTTKGVSERAADIISEQSVTSEYFLILTVEGRIGIVANDFKHKHRTGRTKLVAIPKSDEVLSVHPLSSVEVLTVIKNPEEYMGKVRFLEYTDSLNDSVYETVVSR